VEIREDQHIAWVGYCEPDKPSFNLKTSDTNSFRYRRIGELSNVSWISMNMLQRTAELIWSLAVIRVCTFEQHGSLRHLVMSLV
jgi:hypothetical protein